MNRIEPKWFPRGGAEAGRPRRVQRTGRYDQNVGVPGVVYILHNEGLRAGYLKIGCSRHSGRKRAFQLNEDAGTGTPGTFHCVFEQRTQDCGRAEQLVFQRLQAQRRGKWGQEFFEVDLDLARRTIRAVCAEVDAAPVRTLPSLPPFRAEPARAYEPPPFMRARSGSPDASSGNKAQVPGEVKLSRSGAIWAAILVAVLVIWWARGPQIGRAQEAHSTAATVRSVSQASPPPQQAFSHEAKASKPPARLPAGQRERPRNPASAQAPDASGSALPDVQQIAAPEQTEPPQVQQRPDLSGLTQDERRSAEAACATARRLQGTGGYNACLIAQARELEEVPPVDLTGFSKGDVQLLESVCSTAKSTKGPAAYRACLGRHALAMPSCEAVPSRPGCSARPIISSSEPRPPNATGN